MIFMEISKEFYTTNEINRLYTIITYTFLELFPNVFFITT
jgi:hypothetical protein